jgi:hypothetical protein
MTSSSQSGQRQRPLLTGLTFRALGGPGDTAAEPGDLRPWVVAHALIGAHQSLIEFVRRRLLDGPVNHARLAREVAARGRQALDLLEQGLATYGARPAAG